MFDQLSAEIVPSLIKGVTTPTTPTTTTKQNVYPAVYYVYSRIKTTTTIITVNSNLTTVLKKHKTVD
jgi:hypothetical protein